MQITNTAIVLNNQNVTNTHTFTINGLNKIDNTKDVGLSIWADQACSLHFPGTQIQYSLQSTAGTFTLGTIDENGGSNGCLESLPGSFYYENNMLHGLVDDTPDSLIDYRDALANIKHYIINNTATFTLNTTTNVLPGGSSFRDGYTLAYTTPCPARSNRDTTLSYTICSGNNVQLNGTSLGTYTWSAPGNSLNHYNIPNPVANPTTTTTYIALVDSNGCKHTEHFKVNVYTTPKTDSVKTTIGICGSTAGTATIVATIGSPTSYTVNGIVQSSPSYTNLAAGTYTFALANNFGCTYTSPKAFIIKDTNLAKARFVVTPTSGCAPLSVNCTNYSNYTGTLYNPVTNKYTWYVNGDSATTTNFNYTFTDTGKYIITLFAYETLRKCSATTTQTIIVKDCPPDSIHLTVPNIFSPNADGINDSWQIAVSSYQYTVNSYSCVIYDRWGIQVFETSNISEAWSGRTTSGLPSSAGTYFYIIKLNATDSKGVSENKDFKGYLELVR
jgi:gliding motility-associated-like protein